MKKNVFRRALLCSIPVLIALLCVLTGCDSGSSTPKDPDVYVAGYEDKGSERVGKVWKNGEVIFTSLHTTSQTEILKVIVENGSVYVAEYEQTSSPFQINYYIYKDNVLQSSILDAAGGGFCHGYG